VTGSSDNGADLELPPLPEEKKDIASKKSGSFLSFLFKKKEETPPAPEPPKPEQEEDKFAPPPEIKVEEKKFKCKICDSSFETQKELKAHMKREHPRGIKYVLVIETGDRITDLDELINAIKYMKDETYQHHTSTKNEFADWVENALGKKELAERLRKAEDRVDAIRVLYGKEPKGKKPASEHKSEQASETEKLDKKDEIQILPPPPLEQEPTDGKEEKSSQQLENEGKPQEANAPRSLLEVLKRKKVEQNISKVPESSSTDSQTAKGEQPPTQIGSEDKNTKRSLFEALFRKKEQKKPELPEPLPEQPSFEKFGKENLEKSEGQIEKGDYLRKERDDLEELNKELEEKDSEIKESIGELLKDKNYIRAKNKELSEKIRTLNSAQRKLDRSREMLNKQMEKIERRARELYKKEQSIRERQRIISEQDRLLEKKKREYEKFKVDSRQLKILRNELPKVRQEYATLLKKIRETDQKLRKAEERYKKISPGLEKQKMELREREAELARKEAELEQQKSQLMDIQYRLVEEKHRLEEERFQLYLKQELSKGEDKAQPISNMQAGVNQPREYLSNSRNDFEAAVSQAMLLAQSGNIREANFIAERLESETQLIPLSETEKKERLYKILELKTEIRLASVKGK